MRRKPPSTPRFVESLTDARTKVLHVYHDTSRSLRFSVSLGLCIVLLGSGCKEEASKSESPESATDAGGVQATDDPFGFVRRTSIDDIPGMESPDPEGPPTTMLLARRSKESERQVAPEVTLQTRCGNNYCVDGLFTGETALLEPKAGQAPGAAGRLERVVRVTHVTDEYVSAYIATSRYTGGANAENDLRCRTFDRRDGGRVRLAELLEEQTAERLIAKAEGLMDPNRAISVVGRSLDGSGMTFRPAGFRLTRTSDSSGELPEIVLCGNGESAGSYASILEMRIEEFPVGYLLRPIEE